MNLLTLAISLMLVCFINPAGYIGRIYYYADISSRNNALLRNFSTVQLHNYAIARMFGTTVLIVKIVDISTYVLAASHENVCSDFRARFRTPLLGPEYYSAVSRRLIALFRPG